MIDGNVDPATLAKLHQLFGGELTIRGQNGAVIDVEFASKVACAGQAIAMVEGASLNAPQNPAAQRLSDQIE